MKFTLIAPKGLLCRRPHFLMCVRASRPIISDLRPMSVNNFFGPLFEHETGSFLAVLQKRGPKKGPKWDISQNRTMFFAKLLERNRFGAKKWGSNSNLNGQSAVMEILLSPSGPLCSAGVI